MQINGKKIAITGGGGFLGTHLAARFEQGGANVCVPRSAQCDLRDYGPANAWLQEVRPDVVVHAAADVGGIGYIRACPADIFRNNLLMCCNVLEGCRRIGVEKLVIIGSACAYPGEVSGVLREEDFLAGQMHTSVESYGFSKRALYLGAKAYRDQYGLNSIFLVLTNLFGPHDKYDPAESHVVAALIRKFVEAVDNDDPVVECWGTGTPIREFLYAPDCAAAAFLAAELYHDLQPLNIGTGVGTSIKELAETVARLAQFRGEIRWDTNKPDGAMKKVLDVSHMTEALSWRPSTSLEDGLRRTIQWYRENRPA